MSYFADLTPHVYTPTDGLNVVNVGWLSGIHLYTRGEVSVAFREALCELCEHRVQLHRGLHECEFCPKAEKRQWNPGIARMGNGQIRILGPGDIWYAAPTMIHHYVVKHLYQPPVDFIEAILNPIAVAVRPGLKHVKSEDVANR